MCGIFFLGAVKKIVVEVCEQSGAQVVEGNVTFPLKGKQEVIIKFDL